MHLNAVSYTCTQKFHMILDTIRTKGRPIYWVVLMFSLCIACSSDPKTKIPDVADIDVDLEIIRFDQLLLQDTTQSVQTMLKLLEEHPAFAEVYFRHVAPGVEELLTPDDTELRLQYVREWIRHPRTRWLYDTVMQIFPDIRPLEAELTSAFRYARYYFPDKETPKIYTTLSDFGYFPFLYAEDSLRDGIGISLEMFLGKDFPYMTYTGINSAFSDYLVRSYNKDHIARRTLEVWVDDMAGPPPGNRLLDLMIHNGRKLYILEKLLPTTHDSVIIDYPAAKLEWVLSHERNVWHHFTSQDLLYETSLNKIQKFIGPSPSSPGMPPESPGNTGSWLGWQLVRSFMTTHPDMSLQELLELKDAQFILDESGYRPPRK